MTDQPAQGHLRLPFPPRETNVAVDGLDLVKGQMLVIGGDNDQRGRSSTAEVVRVVTLHGRPGDPRAAVVRGMGDTRVRDWPSGTLVRPVDTSSHL